MKFLEGMARVTGKLETVIGFSGHRDAYPVIVKCIFFHGGIRKLLNCIQGQLSGLGGGL